MVICVPIYDQIYHQICFGKEKICIKGTPQIYSFKNVFNEQRIYINVLYNLAPAISFITFKACYFENFPLARKIVIF